MIRSLLRPISWARIHPWKTAGLVLVISFVVINVLAYHHARGMLTYRVGIARPTGPDELSAAGKVAVLFGGVEVPRPENVRSPDDVRLLMSSTVRFTSADGTSLEGWAIPHRVIRGTVLLFHGYSAARDSLLDQAVEFYHQGYNVMLTDFRGCGGSAGNKTTLGYREAEDVAAAVAFVRSRRFNGPIILFGESMGGAAVLRAVSQLNVEADAVIVESPFDRMLTTVRNRFELMSVPSFPAAELLVFWGGVQAGIPAFEHNPIDYARNVRCPTLILHGDSDRMVKPTEARAIYDQLPGTKQIESFPGATHQSLYHADRDRWRAVVTQFLEAGREPGPFAPFIKKFMKK